MSEDYGLYVWPSAVILGEYIWQQKHRFSEANVVEVFFFSLNFLVI